MKKLLHYAFFLTLALGVACEGPEGPPGPEGEPGPPGTPGATGPAGEDAQRASVLDLSGWNFEPDEEGFYILGIAFEDYGMVVAPEDVVVVYRMAYFDEEIEAPVWIPLPQIIIREEGIIQYNFIHTDIDLAIFIESQFSLAEFPGITTNQVFRIVALPGEAVAGARLKTVQPRDLSTLPYEEVIEMYGINDKNVPSHRQK